jgi:hypothetical protein
MLISALFTIAKVRKQPRCPTTDEWIKKIGYIYTIECYSTIRNNDVWFEGKQMQLEDIMLSEVRQAQKDKNYMFTLICVRYIQKINIYTKTSMITYKHICRTCLL